MVNVNSEDTLYENLRNGYSSKVDKTDRSVVKVYKSKLASPALDYFKKLEENKSKEFSIFSFFRQ
ncbi:MAG: hypothetical protein ACRCWQ_11360 [Bacilli bacterium]